MTAELRRRQMEAWERGERVTVERLLNGAAVAEEDLLDLIYAEVVLREEAGEAPTAEEYARRFPQFSEAIERQFAVHAHLAPLEALQSWSLLSTYDSTPKSPVTAPRELPQIAGYEIVRELGRGGMGVVYEARQTQLKRTVALKTLLDAALGAGAVRERFRIEAAAVAKLQHPNIVQIYEFHDAGPLPYFSLEFVAGGNLAEFTRRRPQPIAAVVDLIATLARALDHAHRHGIVHRDLKPANILLARRGETSAELTDFVPKLTDFGLAKDLADGSDLTQTEAVLGTYLYMSPEQAWGRSKAVAPATDLHALGLILYELLTGKAPFEAGSLAATLDAVRYLDPPPPSSLRKEVPAELDAICRKCLAKNPELRYRTAGELAEELQRFARGEPLQATPLGRPAPSRLRLGLIAAGTTLLLLAAGLFAWQAQAVRTTPESFAVLVGVRSYRLPDQALDLEYTESDVDELSRVLFKQGFPRRNIKLLTQWSESDNPELAPTRENIRRQLTRVFAGCIPGDTVLVAITGMGGDLGDPPQYCYLPADGDPRRPNSLFTLAEFYDLFRTCPAERKVLLVDTCQSISGDLPASQPTPEPPPGLAVLFACGPQQASFEHRDLRHGVFSYFVLRGLEGAADLNQDGAVTLGELRSFTQRGVEDFVAEKLPGGMQSPELISNLPQDTPLIKIAKP